MVDLIVPGRTQAELVPTVKWGDWTFPIRVVNEEVLKSKGVDAKMFAGLVLVQLNDKDNLLWAGLMALAKDIYDRDPSKSRQFLDFVSSMGLTLRDGRGKTINVEQELLGVLNKI